MLLKIPASDLSRYSSRAGKSMKVKLVLMSLGAYLMFFGGCRSHSASKVKQPAVTFSEPSIVTPSASTVETATTASHPKSSSNLEKSCLDCHGPFKELISKTIGFKVDTGRTVNPHRYVPHDSEDIEDIPKCFSCHIDHTVPLESKKTPSKANIEWCYSFCHHIRDFRNCQECH
jgi:hypothetical protein